MYCEKGIHFDNNAIFITNNGGQKIGYVKRGQAKFLALLFDRTIKMNITIEERMYSDVNLYNQELHLHEVKVKK